MKLQLGLTVLFILLFASACQNTINVNGAGAQNTANASGSGNATNNVAATKDEENAKLKQENVSLQQQNQGLKTEADKSAALQQQLQEMQEKLDTVEGQLSSIGGQMAQVQRNSASNTEAYQHERSAREEAERRAREVELNATAAWHTAIIYNATNCPVGFSALVQSGANSVTWQNFTLSPNSQLTFSIKNRDIEVSFPNHSYWLKSTIITGHYPTQMEQSQAKRSRFAINNAGLLDLFSDN